MGHSEPEPAYFDFRKHVDEFLQVYSARPFRRNWGGMGFNHSFAVYTILRSLQPTLVVESGVWKGYSTWLISQALPGAQIVALDPRPDFREIDIDGVQYFAEDFAGINWTEFDISNSVCFFDDHVSALARLMEMKWAGFTRAIFEDNYAPGEGDMYSLRHIQAGVGHPRIQMSRGFELRGKERRIRLEDERLLEKYYWRQFVIRHPNSTDAALLERNLVRYIEAPPLYLGEPSRQKNHEILFGEDAPEPLLLDLGKYPVLYKDLSGLGDVDYRQELSYGRMAYVEI